jgi:hypothetical protein
MTTMSFLPSESNRKTKQTHKQQHHTPHTLPGHKQVVTYDTTKNAVNVELTKIVKAATKTKPILPKTASKTYLHSLNNPPRQPSEQDYEAARMNDNRRRAIK